MPIFNNLSVSQRLYLATLLIAAALLGVTALAWSQLSHVRELAVRTESTRVPQMQRISDIELNVTRTSLQLRHAMLVRTSADLQATLADIAEKKKHIDSDFAAFDKAVFTDEGRAAFARLTPLAQAFWTVAGANVRLIEEGRKDEAFDTLVQKTIPARNLLLAELEREKTRQRDALSTELVEVQDEAARARSELLGMVLAVAVGLLAFSWSIARVLRQRVQMSQQVAERVRQGDLTVPVSDAARDEFSPLLLTLDQMQVSLRQIVGTVRQNAESVAAASGQIAQGNHDLSSRTEEQASALQQTAASMEQLGTTVRQNATHALEANRLASDASNVATQGGTVVAEVVNTMRGINDSARQIADIIGTIDGIAFQTNILALNAAVEAARAGEQGRGFAVVAGEVRSLAQRSAQAAKEIKDLIGASVARVEQGTALVDQAGSTMSEVVAAIQRVADIVAEISTASREQSQGVSQVGEAVTQMDQATQQNAALVEESAAAAASLNMQAQQLVDAVAVFRIAAQAALPVAARPALLA
jgi:methyl-accepting chemotaxis protein